MKKLLTFLVVVALLVTTIPAMADITYTIDFGATNVLSDAGIVLSQWGEAESGGGAPGRADGNYGLIGNGNCRMVWGHTASGDLTDWAQIVFPMAITSITIDHLNGTEYDSFNVIVDGVLWGGYVGINGGNGEVWKTTTFNGLAGSTVMIDITSPSSVWRETWGQLGIDSVEATAVPEPVTIALLGLGGLLLRRRHN